MECVMWLFIDVPECPFKIHGVLLLWVLLSSFICWLFSVCLTFKDLQISSLNDLTSHLSEEGGKASDIPGVRWLTHPAQLEKVISTHGLHVFNQQEFLRVLDF